MAIQNNLPAKEIDRVGGKKVGRRVHGPWEITPCSQEFCDTRDNVNHNLAW